MQIENIKVVFDNQKSSDLEARLGEDQYIVAVQDPQNRRSTKKFLIPLFYYDGYEWEKIDTNSLGERIFIASSPQILEADFSFDEFIKITHLKTNTKWTNDKKYNLDNSLTKYITHIDNKNNHLYEESIIDIVKGRLEIDRHLFYPNRNFYNLVQDIYVKQSKRFFIESEEGVIMGPFTGLQTNPEDKSIRVSGGIRHEIEVFDLPDYAFLELQTDLKGPKRKVIKSYTDIEIYVKDRLDFLTREELFDWVNTQLSDKDKLESVRELWDTITSNSKVGNVSSRFKRLENLFENTQNSYDGMESLIQTLANNEYFTSSLGELPRKKIEMEKALYDLKNLKKLEEKEIQKLDEALENQKAELEKFISYEESKREELRKEREELIEREIKEGQQKLEWIQSELEQKGEQLEVYQLHQKKAEIAQEIESLRTDKNEIQQSIELLKKDFIDTQQQTGRLLHDLVKTKTHFDLITARTEVEASEGVTRPKRFTVEGEKVKDLKELVNLTHQAFQQSGRQYSEHFIANLLISTHQNNLTLFWGLPGTGKTTLCRMLMQMLAPTERQLQIPVARGWTSQKDLVGFANPISKRFHRSASGLYDLLKQLDGEFKEEWYWDTPYAYTLLDEANLSPLEHYWAMFYNHADSVVNNKDGLVLQLGNGEEIHYANNLRFLGTINMDRTTEDLSPRMLDRANIIRLDLPSNMQLSPINDYQGEPLSITMQQILQFFNLQDFKTVTGGQTVKFNDIEVEDKFNYVVKQLSKIGVQISPRVKMSIISYCNVAQSVMAEQFRPLDYCIAQRLLTKIDVQGSHAVHTLRNLLDFINDFALKDSRASQILSKIIEKGEREGYSHNYFNYFMLDR
ncbi:ATP-binding protein [Sediminitomix flava]|uniref:Dynein-related subfamily AAA family protein n=1 Tax=Sediminitomix flava TaxID=379075 RepID=A0A315ZHK4_SEDFL|nr:ATP-binding protein [Sediminitomix flava]PWJ44679.1 hypothetical protein BC781_1011050 [Sediminitomix flava]